MGKIDRCALLACNDDRLFAEKYALSSLFARKERVNAERVPPGHAIILLKSNKFNMAAVLVKRSIVYFLHLENSQPASHIFPWPFAVNVTIHLSNSHAFCPNCNNFDNL